jgi:hypothetical protein
MKRSPLSVAELVDERIKRAILVVRRTEITQPDVRLAVQALRQCCGDAGLADARFAGDQHDLAVAALGALPAPQQQLDLLVAADQRGQRQAAQSLETANCAPSFTTGACQRWPPHRNIFGTSIEEVRFA